MSFNKKTWLANDNLTEKEMNNLEDRTEQGFNELSNELEKTKDYVIDFGENSKGKWEKWESGKLVQWGVIKKTSEINIAWGALFREDEAQKVTFPIPFVGEFTLLPVNSYSGHAMGGYVSEFNSTSFEFRGWSERSRTFSLNLVFGWYAVGRWK